MRSNRFILNSAIAAILMAGAAAAKTSPGPVPGIDAIERGVVHKIVTYPLYTIFDQVDFQLNDGNVRLFGEVTEPWKKSELGNLVAEVPGVSNVDNELKVAPVSAFDNRIRAEVARAIYNEPSLSRYRIQAIPPIHIIVDNGHVTLTGVVYTDMDKEVAGIRANSSLTFGTVTNDLRVEQPSPNKK